MDYGRMEPHRRNQNLEILLKKINKILNPVEIKEIESFQDTKYPVVMLVGCARCGATIIMQWLSNSGIFSYPTNLVSRFYEAPYIGALIQQMLTSPEYNFKDEIIDFNNDIAFESDLGKTKGALSPHHFYYFWRRYFQYEDIQYIEEELQKNVDVDGFRSEIAAVESVFNKPFALKGNFINWNIPLVSGIFNKILFIHTKRHPFYNAQSLLEARKNFFGDINRWYSFKPPEYEFLKELDPYTQVAGQVFFTNKAIEEGLNRIEKPRWFQSNYSEFCKTPKKLYERIIENLAVQGYETPDRNYKGPTSFRNSNIIRLSDKETEKIIDAYRDFSGTVITL